MRVKLRIFFKHIERLMIREKYLIYFNALMSRVGTIKNMRKTHTHPEIQ